MSQLIRHAIEAYYLLTDTAEDQFFRYVVSGTILIAIVWYATSLHGLTEENVKFEE